MQLSINTSNFEKFHVLVIGDLMIDQYIWGDVNRISPEAPVPVLHIRKRSEVLGGAGNVVRNLAGLGCRVTIIGVRGKDTSGKKLTSLLANDGVCDLSIENPDQPTITKTRLVSGGNQLLRLDDENIMPLRPDIYRQIIKAFSDRIDDCDAIILSDYGKGILQTEGLGIKIIKMAQKASIPIFVDPKGIDWARYKGATCVTPNSIELQAIHNKPINQEHDLINAMHATIIKYDLDRLLVTRGPNGMCLMDRNKQYQFIPSKTREVYDVSGAGDTVIATLALGVGSGYSFIEAATLANLAAGIVVGKLGTQPINKFELNAAIGMQEQLWQGGIVSKIASSSAASIQIKAWKAGGDIIVFTNGCFDLLHPGHIHLLNHCKQMGDKLIVGLNADESVCRLKGSSRPILAEQDRASLLGALGSVDLVVLFMDDTPEKLLRELKPDILVKGADYRLDQIVGRDIVESYGGKVQTIPLLEGYSTSNIANKVLNHK